MDHRQPVVNRFWSQGRQPSFDYIAQKYGDRISGKQLTDPYLILFDGTPIGYAQTYLWWDYPGYCDQVDLTGAASLDLLISELAYRNRGVARPSCRSSCAR